MKMSLRFAYELAPSIPLEDVQQAIAGRLDLVQHVFASQSARGDRRWILLTGRRYLTLLAGPEAFGEPFEGPIKVRAARTGSELAKQFLAEAQNCHMLLSVSAENEVRWLPGTACE